MSFLFLKNIVWDRHPSSSMNSAWLNARRVESHTTVQNNPTNEPQHRKNVLCSKVFFCFFPRARGFRLSFLTDGRGKGKYTYLYVCGLFIRFFSGGCALLFRRQILVCFFYFDLLVGYARCNVLSMFKLQIKPLIIPVIVKE